MKKTGSMTVMITLNGTAENPFHKMGLTQNPFPQHGTYETNAAMLALQSLGGDPIPHATAAAYITERLKPHCSDDFIAHVVAAFQPGVYVTVKAHLSWPA